MHRREGLTFQIVKTSEQATSSRPPAARQSNGLLRDAGSRQTCADAKRKPSISVTSCPVSSTTAVSFASADVLIVLALTKLVGPRAARWLPSVRASTPPWCTVEHGLAMRTS
eukprot:scaffold65675_cov85-Phaeocystis_antarctica.AAC.3